MSHETIKNQQPLILTTGVYDLVKDHLRRKKVSSAEEEVLRHQLKTAMQVPRKHLPTSVVSVDTRVTIKNHHSNQNETFVFVAPHRAKKKNQTESILSPMGLALVGCKEGDTITWDFNGEPQQIEILNVERLSS